MKLEGFAASFAVSAFLAGYFFLSGAVEAAPALALFALAQAGYFALAELKKCGMATPAAETAFAAAILACYFAAALSLSALSSLLSLSFVPLVLLVPAITGAVHHYVSG